MNSRIIQVVSLLISVAILFGYVGPMWSGSIAQTKNAIALDDQALAAARQYTAQQNELASQRNAIDPTNLARLQTFLPDSVDNVGLILDLNALAARSGLSLANVDVAATGARSDSGNSSNAQTLPASDTNPIGSVDLSLSAVGTYSALKAFLVGIEKSARLLDVRQISIKGSETGVYNYSLSLRLYWLR